MGTKILPRGFGGRPSIGLLSDALPIGWSRIDATLVSADGTWRICEVVPSQPVDQLDRCDGGFAEASGLTGGHVAGTTSWFHGPLVLFVDESGDIELIANTGGCAASADG